MGNTLENTTWDAVIVGAGPSGSAAAISLANSGKTVLLIDKSAFPRDKVCGCCLNEKSLKFLDQLDVLKNLTRLVSSRLKNLTLSINNNQFNVPLSGKGIAVSRKLLDQLLIDKAVEVGVTFLPSTKVKIEKESTTNQRNIEIHKLNSLEKEKIKTKYLIIATGLSSPKIFTCKEDQDAYKTYISKDSYLGIGAKIPINSLDIDENEIKMYVGKNGYIGITKLEDGNIDLAGAISTKKSLHKSGQELIQNAVSTILPNHIFKNKHGINNINWQGTPLLTRESKLNLPNIFLIGDANRYVEPFTGQGIGWALESGILVSKYLTNNYPQKDWIKILKNQQGLEMLKCSIVKNLLRYPRVASNILDFVIKTPKTTRFLTSIFDHGERISQ